MQLLTCLGTSRERAKAVTCWRLPHASLTHWQCSGDPWSHLATAGTPAPAPGGGEPPHSKERWPPAAMAHRVSKDRRLATCPCASHGQKGARCPLASKLAWPTGGEPPHSMDQKSTNLPFISSSFAPLRLCARQSLHHGTFDSGCLTANPFIPVKSFLAQRRKDAKFFRIKKFRIFGNTVCG